ncbi:MAG TPA: AI-2E family transporter [Phycisphaerae bacterium]|nr:AI-2E family transporter [Phycisphaerae bacterium]
MAVDPKGAAANGQSVTQVLKSDEARGFFRLASPVLIICILYFGKAVLEPFAMAFLLTFALVPAVTWLERLRLRRLVSVLVVIVCGLLLTCSVGWIVKREVVKVAAQWPEFRLSVRGKVHDFKQWTDSLEGLRTEITDAFSDESSAGNGPSSDAPTHESTLSPNSTPPAGTMKDKEPPISVRISPEPTSVVGSAGLYIQALMIPLAAALLVVVMLIFMLLRWEDLRDRAISIIGASRNQVARDTIREAAKRVSRFLVAQSVINICFGATAAVGLWVIHLTVGGRASVAAAITAGLVCGVLRFIPYVGVWIGACVPLAFTFAAYPNNAVFLVTLAMFLLLEAIFAQVIEPRWLGASVGISPTGIMMSTVFWTWLWGPMGLLLATPLTVSLVVMGKHIPRFRYLYVLLADRRDLDSLPPSSPPKVESPKASLPEEHEVGSI